MVRYREVKDIGDARYLGDVRLTRRQLLIAASLSAIATACGVPGQSPKPGGSQAAPSAVAGGTLKLLLPHEPTPLSTILPTSVASTMVVGLFSSQLTRLDPTSKLPVPDLATGFEVADDGLSWVLHLEPSVKWHDGEPFSADDVVFTFGEIQNPDNASAKASLFGPVTKVEAIDANTVRFDLSSRLMSFPILLAASNALGMIPKHILEGQDLTTADEFNNERPIGTGPFKVKTVSPGSYVELEAYEDFFRGRPLIDTVIYTQVPDQTVRVAQLQSGEADFDMVSPASLAAVQADDGLKVNEVPSTRQNHHLINHTLPIFDDKNLRLALAYALDRQAILDAAGGGLGTLTFGPIAPAAGVWYNADAKPLPYDPDKAAELLDESGWVLGDDGVRVKDGQRLSLKCSYDTADLFKKQYNELAQQYWLAVGIDIELVAQERTVWADDLKAQKFELAFYDRGTAIYDPDALRRFWTTDGGTNYSKYSNPRVDELFTAGVQELDQDRRKEIYREVDTLLAEDGAFVPGYFPTLIQAMNTRLEGVPVLDFVETLMYADDWYLS